MTETSILPRGTQVRVSDGTPRPPDRFKRKLAEWETKNFDGVVSNYQPEYGGYTVQKGNFGGWIRVFTSGVRAEKITVIPGTSPLKMTEPDGCGDCMVAV